RAPTLTTMMSRPAPRIVSPYCATDGCPASSAATSNGVSRNASTASATGTPSGVPVARVRSRTRIAASVAPPASPATSPRATPRPASGNGGRLGVRVEHRGELVGAGSPRPAGSTVGRGDPAPTEENYTHPAAGAGLTIRPGRGYHRGVRGSLPFSRLSVAPLW